MKTLILLLIPFFSIAQIGAGITGGVGSKHSEVGEVMIAVNATKNIIIYPVTIKVHSRMSDPTMPVIFEPRIAYKLGGWELYGGYGYHFAGQDGKEQYRQYQGFKPGVGVIYHIGRVLIVTAGISGKVATIQLGIFNSK